MSYGRAQGHPLLTLDAYQQNQPCTPVQRAERPVPVPIHQGQQYGTGSSWKSSAQGCVLLNRSFYLSLSFSHTDVVPFTVSLLSLFGKTRTADGSAIAAPAECAVPATAEARVRPSWTSPGVIHQFVNERGGESPHAAVRFPREMGTFVFTRSLSSWSYIGRVAGRVEVSRGRRDRSGSALIDVFGHNARHREGYWTAALCSAMMRDREGTLGGCEEHEI